MPNIDELADSVYSSQRAAFTISVHLILIWSFHKGFITFIHFHLMVCKQSLPEFAVLCFFLFCNARTGLHAFCEEPFHVLVSCFMPHTMTCVVHNLTFASLNDFWIALFLHKVISFIILRISCYHVVSELWFMFLYVESFTESLTVTCTVL